VVAVKTKGCKTIVNEADEFSESDAREKGMIFNLLVKRLN
jgi:hypothetical protein